VDTKSKNMTTRLDFLYKVMSFCASIFKVITLETLHKVEMSLACLEIFEHARNIMAYHDML
jgi:hypothetical protein